MGPSKGPSFYLFLAVALFRPFFGVFMCQKAPFTDAFWAHFWELFAPFLAPKTLKKDPKRVQNGQKWVQVRAQVTEKKRIEYLLSLTLLGVLWAFFQRFWGPKRDDDNPHREDEWEEAEQPRAANDDGPARETSGLSKFD